MKPGLLALVVSGERSVASEPGWDGSLGVHHPRVGGPWLRLRTQPSAFSALLLTVSLFSRMPCGARALTPPALSSGAYPLLLSSDTLELNQRPPPYTPPPSHTSTFPASPTPLMGGRLAQHFRD